MAALQHLTPPQRAVVILRDVLAWQASEVAELLDISVAAVNSSLQRARAPVHKLDPDTESASRWTRSGPRRCWPTTSPRSSTTTSSRIVELLADDAVWEMPPYVGWYSGSRDDRRADPDRIARRKAPGDQVLVPTQANGQPAFGLYMRQPDGWHDAFQLQVLTLDRDRVAM